MARTIELDPAQNRGDFTGKIPPDEYIEPIFDPLQSCGDFDFGEIKVSEGVIRIKKMNNSEKDNIGKPKKTAFVVGTTMAIGVLGGGVLLHEYRKKHR